MQVILTDESTFETGSDSTKYYITQKLDTAVEFWCLKSIFQNEKKTFAIWDDIKFEKNVWFTFW